MSFNKKNIVSVVVVLGLAMLYVAAVAHTPQEGNPGGRVSCLKNMGLTEAEISKVKEIKLTYRKAGVDIKAEKEKYMLELRHLVSTGSATNEEIELLVGKIARVKKRALRNKIDCITESARVIENEDVRKKFLEVTVGKCLSSKKYCKKTSIEKCENARQLQAEKNANVPSS